MVAVGVGVSVNTGVAEGVAVSVGVSVISGVFVGVAVSVGVLVGAGVFVGVGVDTTVQVVRALDVFCGSLLELLKMKSAALLFVSTQLPLNCTKFTLITLIII